MAVMTTATVMNQVMSSITYGRSCSLYSTARVDNSDDASRRPPAPRRLPPIPQQSAHRALRHLKPVRNSMKIPQSHYAGLATKCRKIRP